MNERIHELADQAGVSIMGANSNGVFTLLPAKQKKFAELIVKECLFIIDDEREPEMVSRIKLWKQIIEHFGVEK